MGELKSTYKSSFHYIIFAFLSKGLSFFITPYITFMISAEEFGFFSEIQIFWGIGVVTCAFGLEEIISKYYVDKREEFWSWYNSITVIQIFVIVFLSLTYLSYRIYFFGFPTVLKTKYLIFPMWVSGTVIYYNYLRYLRISENKNKYFIVSSSYMFFQFLLIYVGLNIKIFSGYATLFISYSVTAFIFAILSLIDTSRNYKKFQTKQFLEVIKLIRFSKNILLNNISEWALRSLPLLFLASYVNGKITLGLFTSLSIFTIGFVELAKAIINGILPKILKFQKEEDTVRFLSTLNIYRNIGVGTAFFLMFTSKYFYRYIINPDYTTLVNDGVEKLVVILGLFLFLGIYQNQVISYNEKLSRKIAVYQSVVSFVLIFYLFNNNNISLENIYYLLICSYATLYLIKEFAIMTSIGQFKSSKMIKSVIPFLVFLFL